MASFNYDSENFLDYVSSGDTTIKISDKNNNLIYTINPEFAYFYYKNNNVIIKKDDNETIYLDFETNQEAILAIQKLNDIKKELLQYNIESVDYYTKTELNNGVLNNLYFTQTAVTENFSQTGHSHNLTGLTDVNVNNLLNGEVLVYSAGTWVNSSFTFNVSAFTSNYYDIIQLSGSNSGSVFINWDNIINTPDSLSGYGITNVYTKDETYHTGQTYTKAEADSRYYTQTWINTHYFDNNYINTYFSPTSHTHYLSGLTDVSSVTASNGQLLQFTGGTWKPVSILNDYYTTTQTDDLLLSKSNTGHSHDFTGLTSTAHTHIWTDLSNTSHTHIFDELINTAHTHNEYSLTSHTHDQYSLTGHSHDFTGLTSTAHTHDERYYTKTLLDNGQLDTRYFTKTWITGHYYDMNHIDAMIYTTGETDTLLNNLETSIAANYYNSAQTNALFYNSAQTNILLFGKSDTGHTHNLSGLTDVSLTALTNGDVLTYSGGTWINKTPDFDSSLYYTKTESNILYSPSSHTHNQYSLTSHTHDQYSLTSHTHNYSELLNTGHSHDEDYYTQTWIETHYYTINQVNNLLSGFTSTADTANLLLYYYTSAQTDALLLGKSDTGHTHNLTGLSDVTIDTLVSGQTIVYSAGTWMNKTLSFDTSNFYTKAETDASFSPTSHTHSQYSLTSHTHDQYSLTGHSHDFTGLTSTAHTHDERYYTKTLLDNGQLDTRYFTKSWITTHYYDMNHIDAMYYTTGETDALLNNYYTTAQTNDLLLAKSNTGHSHDFTGLTSTAHTHLWTDISNTSHTHDERYYLNTYIDTFYYTSAQTNDLLLGKSNTGHTHSFSELTNSAHTHYYSEIAGTAHTHNFDDLANTAHTHYYYEIADTAHTHNFDDLANTAHTHYYYEIADTAHTHNEYSLTSHTHALSGLSDVSITTPVYNNILIYSAGTWYNSALTYDILTDTAHSHLWSDIVNTSHTHNDIYYTKTLLDAGQLDSRYFTKSWITTHYYDMNHIDAMYYTTGETDLLLSGYSLTSHTHSQYSLTSHTHLFNLSGMGDVTFTALTNGDLILYSAGTWYNTASTSLFNNYYNKSEVNTLISGITFSGITSVTNLYELNDVDSGITTASDGESLVWSSSLNKWVNSAVTSDLSGYYTSAETNAIFFTSAQTLDTFSETGHSHYLTGLTDVSSVTATNGQLLQFSAGTWIPRTINLTGNYVSITGDTMTGNLSFDYMTGTTDRILYVNSGGTVNEGSEVISMYITDPSLISYITQTGATASTMWSGNTFIDSGLTAYTLYDGQRYIDSEYFYEYFDGILYRTYYSNKDHNHNDLYYTQTQLLVDGVLDGRYIQSATTNYIVNLGDVNITGSSLTDNSFLRFNTGSGYWEQFDFDTTDYYTKSESVSTGTTVFGVSGLTGGGYLDSNIYLSHSLNTSAKTNIAANGIAVSNIYIDEYGHISSFDYMNLDGYFPVVLSNLQDVTLTSLQNNQVLTYNTLSNNWQNKTISKSMISGFTESDYVHTTGTESISGSKTFSSPTTFNTNVTINGNLFVSGTTTTINSEELKIKDKIITLNTGQTSGYGVDGGLAGIEIIRGWYPNYYILYDEGSVNYSGGTLKIGISGDTRAVPRITNSPVSESLVYWDSVSSSLETSNVFKFYEDDTNVMFGSNAIGTGITLSSALFGSGNTILHNNSTIINGYNLTTVSGDTLHVQNLHVFGRHNLPLSSYTDLTLFYAHTANTNNPHQTCFTGLTDTAHTHTLGDARDGTYADGFFETWTTETRMGYAFDDINELLKKLAPTPPVYLSTRTLSISSSYNALAITTGSLITGITNDTTPLFNINNATSYIADSNDGYITVELDEGSGYSELESAYTFSTGSTDTKTTGVLRFTEGDPYSGQTTGADIFTGLYNMSVNILTGLTESTSAKTVKVSHSITGDVENTFYVDNPVTPSVANISGDLPTMTNYISGVPTVLTSDQITGITFDIENAVSQFYRNGILWYVPSGHVQTSSSSIPDTIPTVTGETLTFTGVSLTFANNQYNDTGITFTIRGYNTVGSYGSASYSTGNTRIDTISDETERVESNSGNSPTIYGGVFDSTYDLMTQYPYELQLKNSFYQWGTVDYSLYGGYDYSNMITGDTIGGYEYRWATFNMGGITGESNITLNFDSLDNIGSGYTDIKLYLTVSGSTGWLDCTIAKTLASPSSDGDGALDLANSTLKSRRVSFGTTPRTGTVYIRVGLIYNHGYYFKKPNMV